MKIKAIILIAAILVFAVSTAIACNNKNSDNNIDKKGVAAMNSPVTSPSGKYQLKIIEETINGVKYNKFSIYKISNGNPESTAVYISSDTFRTSDKLFFVWDDYDRVWVYSGDVGTFFWERVTDTNWEKHAYADNKNVPVPAELKKLKPGYFENN